MLGRADRVRVAPARGALEKPLVVRFQFLADPCPGEVTQDGAAPFGAETGGERRLVEHRLQARRSATGYPGGTKKAFTPSPIRSGHPPTRARTSGGPQG